ncbi:MAG: TRIC cation channel family protein [Dehalococcoidia bacterium]|nr:TRIC cation channel family protein [Dehalococcoidia bacterium]
MDLTASELIGALDRIGLVAFAFGGVEVGARRRLDLFGLLVMGIVAATGGGLIRDLILQRVPLVVAEADYIAWPIGGSLAAIGFVVAKRRIPAFVRALAEAGGTGAFAVAGALAAIGAGLPVTAVVLLGIITATGGGVIRDLLADRIPVVLRTEVNATAAALGAFAVWLVEPGSPELAALFGAGVTALVRVGSLAFDLHLPIPGPPSEPPRGRV